MYYIFRGTLCLTVRRTISKGPFHWACCWLVVSWSRRPRGETTLGPSQHGFVSGMAPRSAALAPSGHLFLFCCSVLPCASCHPPMFPTAIGSCPTWCYRVLGAERRARECERQLEVPSADVAGDDLSMIVSESMGVSLPAQVRKTVPLPGLERITIIQRCFRPATHRHPGFLTKPHCKE